MEELSKKIEAAFQYVRENQMPFFLEVETFRLCGHSKSDNRDYMSEEEKCSDLEKDPLLIIRKSLSEEKAQKIETEVLERIEAVFLQAEKSVEINYSEYREKIGC